MNFPKSELSNQDALQLWNTNHSEYAKEQMVLSNYKIVLMVMKRLSIPLTDEDMFQIGVIGLIKAINTFDTTKGYEFSTYSSVIVRNEMLMEIRKNKKSIKTAISLDGNVDLGNGESISYMEVIADGKHYDEDVINSVLVQQIFEKLNFREKRIFIMFLKGIPQSKIAAELGISQAQVSRIISSMGKIKQKGRKTR